MKRELVTFEHYGSRHSKDAEVMLIVPHDGGHTDYEKDQFFADYPEVPRVFPEDDQTMIDYLNLIRDSGSYELAIATAKALDDLGIHTIIGRATGTRFIDFNRPAKTAVHFSLRSGDGISPSTQDRMLAEHNQVLSSLQSTLSQVRGPSLDVHTMGSQLVKDEFIVRPGSTATFRERLDALLDPSCWKELREEVCLLTSSDDGSVRADPSLSQHLKQGFRNAQIAVQENAPYSISPPNVTPQYIRIAAKHGQGLACADIPKHLLETRKDILITGGDIWNVELDADALAYIGELQALALVSRMQKK